MGDVWMLVCVCVGRWICDVWLSVWVLMDG